MAGGPAPTSGGVIGANGPRHIWSGILMVAFAAFGGILYGYDTGYISGLLAMDDWLCTFANVQGDSCTISTGRKALVTSILSIGTFVGALVGAPVGDFIGRKLGLIITCLVFSVGVVMQVATTDIGVFLAGRVIAGVGVGLVSTLVPMYQSECAPKWIRGAVVSGYQWAITIGLLLASIVDNATQHRADHSSWRIPLSMQFIWAAILAFGMCWLPESPRFLVKKGRDAAAARALARLTGASPDDESVAVDLADIRANLEEERRLNCSSYLDCFRMGEPNKICYRIVTGMALQGWQQLTGVNFVFYYGTSFFKNSGITNSFLISVATNVVNVGMTIPGIYAVDRVGRRKLLIIGAIGMCVCEFIVAIVGVTISVENQAGQKVLIAFVCIYIAFFASTWGPIAWVVVGEIYPLNVRAKGVSLAAASNWLWNFGIGYATPYLVDSQPGDANLGAKVFFIWGATCFCCIVFAYLCIPETKGLSLEQIDLLYMHSTPRTSNRLRRKMLEDDVHAANHKALDGLDARELHSDSHSDEKV